MVFQSHLYHVYIAKCNDGTLYTGITTDLERRLREHNGEKWGGARYTRTRRPIEFLYTEKYETRKEAAKREYEIKHKFSREQKMDLVNKATKDDILRAI